jgi:hypothetical protein
LDDDRYRAYLEREIFSTKNHEEMMARIEDRQLEKIKADPRTGYAVGLDRR